MHNAARPLNTAKQIPLDPQARLGAAARQVDSMRDALGKPVDAGIKSLVTALNVSGFPTTASCEGHLDWGVPAPWVDVAPVPTQESVALYRALCALDAEIETIGYADPEAPALEARIQNRRQLETEVRRPTLVLARSLMALFDAFYRDRRVPYDQSLALHLRLIGFRMQCHGTALQDIATASEKRANLKRYQEEMRTFAAFLTQPYWQGLGE